MKQFITITIFLLFAIMSSAQPASQSGRIGWQTATNNPFYKNPVKFSEIHFEPWQALPVYNRDSVSPFLFNYRDTSLYLHWKGTNKPLIDNAGNLVIDETNLVHKTGSETIPGNKTFTGIVMGDTVRVNTIGIFDGANGYWNYLHYEDQDFVYHKGNGHEYFLTFPDGGAYLTNHYQFPISSAKNTFKLASSVNGHEPDDDGNVTLPIPAPDLSSVIPLSGTQAGKPVTGDIKFGSDESGTIGYYGVDDGLQLYVSDGTHLGKVQVSPTNVLLTTDSSNLQINDNGVFLTPLIHRME